MNKDDRIKEAADRLMSVFGKRPGACFSTNQASATVSDGMKCTFRQGDHTAEMDMPEIMGGEGSAPTPGFFARAGIAGCVSIGIKQQAAIGGVPVRAVTVDIETDFDDSAIYGMGANSAAPLETRLTIRIDSDAPAEVIEKLVSRTLAADPWFLGLRDAQSVKISVGRAG